jgi:hypothetical protein
MTSPPAEVTVDGAAGEFIAVLPQATSNTSVAH